MRRYKYSDGNHTNTLPTWLREAGYAQRTDSKQLTKIDPDNGVEFFYLRPRDIAVYVGEGTLDVVKAAAEKRGGVAAVWCGAGARERRITRPG